MDREFNIYTSVSADPLDKGMFVGWFNGFAVFQCGVTLLRFASARLFVRRNICTIYIHCPAACVDFAVIVAVTIIRVISVVNRVTLLNVSVFTCRPQLFGLIEHASARLLSAPLWRPHSGEHTPNE